MAEEIIGSAIDQRSLALMRELQHSLYQIARRAELDNRSSEAIQAQAEQSLRLIDSYMLSSQAENGQIKLNLEPLAIGSVLHDAAQQMKTQSLHRNVEIQSKARGPVMTNRNALNSLLTAAAAAISDIADRSGDNSIIMRSFMVRGGSIGVGVFTRDDSLSPADLRSALDLCGSSHMPLASHSARSGVMLTVANSLANSLGGSLEVKRMGKFRGFATILPKSDQLALV